MHEWTPSPKSQGSPPIVAPPGGSDTAIARSAAVKKDTRSPCAQHGGPADEFGTRVVAMLALAREFRKTCRYIGMLPFVMYAYLRHVRVHIFFVDRVVDTVEEYALFLCARCAEGKPQATAVFCRCMVFDYNGSRHRVVRRLRSDRDVLRGHHWVIGTPWRKHHSSAVRRTRLAPAASAAVLAVLVCRHWLKNSFASV